MENENKEVARNTQIRIDVELDKDNLPLNIGWQADDSDLEGRQPAKAMMISFFDGIQQNAMRIDLWTNEMRVDEMNLFVYQTLATMADTFQNATQNEKLANEMREFAHHFGHEVDVFGPDHHH